MSESKKPGNFFKTCSIGTQKAIAAKIAAQEADCVLALKGNQTTLHDDVKSSTMGSSRAIARLTKPPASAMAASRSA